MHCSRAGLSPPPPPQPQPLPHLPLRIRPHDTLVAPQPPPLAHASLLSRCAEAAARGGERSVGTVALGGPFTLTNHLGKVTTEKDFLGNFTLMYFGFTHCPDICPEELVKICEAVDVVGEGTAFMFVSLVDVRRRLLASSSSLAHDRAADRRCEALIPPGSDVWLPTPSPRLAEKNTKHQVTPVFVSIDPERDSVQQVKEYVQGAVALTTRISAHVDG